MTDHLNGVFHNTFVSIVLMRDIRHQSSRPCPGQAETMMDIGTRAIFGEEHDMFRTSARRFFQEEVAPNQDRYEKQRHVDREIWEKMGAAGLLGVAIPADKGGVGGDLLMTAITWEEQAYVNGAGTSFPLHSDIVMPYIEEYGTQEQIEKFLPDMAAGKKIGAIAMTEPSAGSDLQGIKTIAKKDGDDYILNGSKVFITNGFLSDVVIVVAITDLSAQKKAHGIGLFLVEEGMPGFTKGRPLEKVGQKAVDTCELFFEDVRLPKSALLGKENQGFYCLMNQLPRERLIVAVGCQAHAEFMFEETRNYVRQRKAFGKTLSNLQVIQHKLAELKTLICVSRSFVDDCLELGNNGKLDTYTASMAKYWTSDVANKVATECLQLHGGWGYMWEYPIARAFCDTRVNSIYAGSNEIMKELIYRPIVASQ
ncbi:long-chain specific acyl-CoA dehydrogenase, mitochondrial-like [Lytechinus variegatus]|uniref:long-chain specific acyl-CoA dehydrogenase, mitochondrial-like n=1 Tax=Lytechinus variegatus TaxID=7654 RepID=UPI001BB29F28|nr:long-chain specific acyl-CoA dehydrogenase, mitochondrial-like [Lytechinus variegatus]